MIRRIPVLSVAILGMTVLSSCVTTSVTGQWRDEAYTGSPKKALVILVTAKPTVMRLFEDEFAQQLKIRGIDAVPGYSLLPSEGKVEKEEVAAAAGKIGADSLFITRLVDKKSYEVYYPGSVYAGPPGPYGPGWGNYYSMGYSYYSASPGYSYQQDILYVETQLFDVKSEKLIWSVMTETPVQNNLESEVKDFVQVIMKNLSKNRIVAKPG